MKKAAFTIQVFCLIAMFPVYMIAELNHSTEGYFINNSPSNSIKETPKKDIPFTLHSAEENSETVLFMINRNNN